MRSFLIVCIAIVMTGLVGPAVAADRGIPDSTGWHRAKGNRVSLQVVETAKLPVDTLIVYWTDQNRPPQTFLATRNALVFYEEAVIGNKTSAYEPAAIRWQTNWRGNRIDWKKIGRTRTVFHVTTNDIASVVYASAAGRKTLAPVMPDKSQPLYSPDLVQTKKHKTKK